MEQERIGFTMTTDPQDKFNEDYAYVRRELVRGQNPFVTVQSMKDWLRGRADKLVATMVEQRQKRAQSSITAHPDRETEWYEQNKRRRGEKEDDDD